MENTSISFINGTCQCTNATAGDTEVINGVTYTVVDNTSLRTEVAAENYNLCTTLVTDMIDLFQENYSFNTDISFWDTSNVTSMNDMFNFASAFNQDISNWDTSNVIDFHSMFYGASAFNQDIRDWDTSSKEELRLMFHQATAFNQTYSWDESSQWIVLI